MDKLKKEKLIQLVKQAKNGDEKAFAHLYEYYIAPIFRFIYFRVKNHTEAEDLTQVVFLKAWNSMEDYKPRGSFSSWLYAIARNSVIDYWRKNKELNIDASMINNLEEDKRPIYDIIEEEEDFKSIKEAIRRLSGDQQEVITLRFIEGLSNKEIAEIVDKTEEAVRQLQSRAIKSLRIFLGENYD